METYELTPLNQKKKVFSYLYKKKDTVVQQPITWPMHDTEEKTKE